MNTLALIVILAQTQPTAQTEPQPQGSLGWAIATPIVSGIGGALMAGRAAAGMLEGSGVQPSFWGTYAATIGGALLGTLAGLYAGKLAREGSDVAKGAALLLYVLSGGMLVFEIAEIAHAPSCNCSILPGPW